MPFLNKYLNEIYFFYSRLGELMNDVIDKHGIVWVASAGNHGPALCTIGTPPDISTNNIIGNYTIYYFNY